MNKFKINKGFISQKIDDKITIFDPDSSFLYTFNETASYIFRKLKIGWDKSKIVENLIKRYKIKADKAEADFAELFSDLKRNGIISA